MSTVTFKFDMHQRIKIVPLGLEGVIKGRCEKPGHQISYLVYWWSDCKAHDEWLLEDDLAAR